MNVQYIFGNPVRKTRKSHGVAKRKKSSNLKRKGNPMAKRKKKVRKKTKKNPKRVHYKKVGAKKTPPKRVVIPKRKEIRTVETALRKATAGLKSAKTKATKLKYLKAQKRAVAGIEKLKQQFAFAQAKQKELKSGGWSVYKTENIPTTRRKKSKKKGKPMAKKRKKKKATKKRATKKKAVRRKKARRKTYKKKVTTHAPKVMKVGSSKISGKYRRKKKSYSVRTRRIKKATYKKIAVRRNPNGLTSKYLAHSSSEALYLLAGGASFGAINSFVMNVPALANVISMIDRVPVVGPAVSRVLGPSLPPLLLGVALTALTQSKYGSKVPQRAMFSKYAKGLISAAIVGLGASIPETITGIRKGVAGFPTMRGVDYTPYNGVDYTPMDGVDYTPMSGDTQQMGAADFGTAEQQLGQYVEEDPGRASQASDFGQAADFGYAGESSSDLGDGVQQMG
jgi:hypothetical protein